MLGPVRGFMVERGILAFRIAERFKRRHPDVIRLLRVLGLRAAMLDIGPQVGKEGFGMLDALHGIDIATREHELSEAVYDLYALTHDERRITEE